MNFLIMLCLASVNIYAGVTSIIPHKTVTPFVQILSPKNRILNDKKAEVRVSSYNSDGEISPDSGRYEMDLALFQTAQAQASAVFRMIPSSSNAYQSSEGLTFVGTAFHIGHNLVLTNQHVLSPDRSNTTECSGFQLRNNGSSEIFSCKKVHYCNVEEDVCLIEMKPAKRCLNFLCSQNELIELKDGPALRLKGTQVVNTMSSETKVMSCIGNTMGHGIHFSQGRGLKINGDRVQFFAPLRPGNSGGPLIADDGLVWGVVKLESGGIKVGANAYNVAENISKVIDLVREQVTDPETLKIFNSAIAE